MNSGGAASTALEFLGAVDADDPVWNDGEVESLVEQIRTLAEQKRLARERSGIERAVAELCIEIDSLRSDNLELDISTLELSNTSAIDSATVMSHLESLTEAIRAYRQVSTANSKANSRTIAEHAGIYQTIAESLSVITNCYEKLKSIVDHKNSSDPQYTPAEALIHRRHKKSTPVSRELWAVAYFLASCGHRVDDGPADPPLEFGEVGWGIVFEAFHSKLGAGRDRQQFKKSLSNLRDYYDAFVDSGRKGWDPVTSPMPRLGHIVMNEWKDRPRKELWEYIQQFVTR